jgi:hypothetical protein
VDGDNGLVGAVVEIDHDFLDHDARQPLSCASIGRRRIPRCRQVMGQAQQGFAIDS